MLFDDPDSLSPDAVVEWHSLCTGALARERQELQRLFLVAGAPPEYLPDHLKHGATQSDVDEYFRDCQEELDISAVFTLIAAAEGRVRRDLPKRVNIPADVLGKRFKVLLGQVDDPWRIAFYDGGIMDAWKTRVASVPGLTDLERDRIRSAIGKLKAVLPIRHWIAHGRYFELNRDIKTHPPILVANAIEALYQALIKVCLQDPAMMEFQ
jgi:hypothetical protein